MNGNESYCHCTVRRHSVTLSTGSHFRPDFSHGVPDFSGPTDSHEHMHTNTHLSDERTVCGVLAQTQPFSKSDARAVLEGFCVNGIRAVCADMIKICII